MSRKVTRIYSVIHDYRDGKVKVVEAEVLRETAKLYWIKRDWPAFETTQVYKELAYITRKDALLAYQQSLAGNVRQISYKLSEANDKLDEFNAQFKEELS